jgi:hypothetical protein
MDPTTAELKLTIAKLIEVAYSQDKGLTTKITLSKGSFKLALDDQGNAMLSSKVGILTFNGSPTLKKMGLNLKTMNASFWTESDNRIHYLATYGINVGSRTVSVGVEGSFDIEELITSCSGLLCQAARHLKGFDSNVDAQMQQIMGY